MPTWFIAPIAGLRLATLNVHSNTGLEPPPPPVLFERLGYRNLPNVEPWINNIDGHRDRGRCRRHRHSGILYLCPVPEHSGTGLVPASAFLFILVPDLLDAGQSIRYTSILLVLVVEKGIPSVQTAGSGK